MFDSSLNRAGPRLLVSVRSAEEAHAALAGGAHIIDVKEPRRGALGAADFQTVIAVVEAVNDRAPVTMAFGELTELLLTVAANNTTLLPPGVALFKIGLANCTALPNWQEGWRKTVKRLRNKAQPVAVVYADWRSADAPTPDDVLAAAIAAESPTLLLDTWQKGAGSLFDHWPVDEVLQFARRVQKCGIMVVLAGSLDGRNLQTAAQLRPDILAVRGAACSAGRESNVTAGRVAALRKLIDEA